MDPTTATRPVFNVAHQLVSYAAELYETEPWELIRKSKHRQQFRPRFAVIWALRRLGELSGAPPGHNPYSLNRIAKMFGYADHTTARHAVIEIERLRAIDPKLRELTDKLLDYAQTLGPQARKAA